MRTFVTQSQARQLLHNKFVVVLGGSVQRSMYKDLILLLQKDQYLTLPQLKSKGEFSFEQDSLVEGGRLGPMTNGTEYREVRQYRSDHHLLRFYFLTRIYSPYMESILEDFRHGLKPDVIIISSCAWDITRYGPECFEQYKDNLHKFFGQITNAVCHDCVILWCLAMPLGKKIKGGFLVPEVSHLGPTLRYNIIEANFYSGRLADSYGLDVLDLHFHFRLSLQHRMPDGVHWDALAHRHISSLLLQHAADAWGVDLQDPPFPPGQDLSRPVHGPCWTRVGKIKVSFIVSQSEVRTLSVPLQRSGLIQHQQSPFRSDRFQLVPPNSDRAVNIRPLLVPTQLANQPTQTAAHHYGAVDRPMRYPRQPHPCRQQNSAAVGVGQFHSLLPVQPHPPPAAGDWTPNRQYSNPLPPANLRRGQQGHLQIRATCSSMNSRFSAGEGFRFRFRPPLQADSRYIRRRRRPDFRTHPYPPQLPWMPPRHPASGCCRHVTDVTGACDPAHSESQQTDSQTKCITV